MCDYSLEHVASRPAKVGDRLTTTRFKNPYTMFSPTVGFCAVDEPDTAVCLLPGTEIAFDQEIEIPGAFWMRRRIGAKLGRFRRVQECTGVARRADLDAHHLMRIGRWCCNCQWPLRSHDPQQSRAKQLSPKKPVSDGVIGVTSRLRCYRYDPGALKLMELHVTKRSALRGCTCGAQGYCPHNGQRRLSSGGLSSAPFVH